MSYYSQTNGDNNNRDSYQPSTKGPKYTNANARSCALNIEYWKDMMKVGFAPELPKEKQSQFRIYDYDNALEIYIGRKKASTFYLGYLKYIKPAIENNVQESISLQFHDGDQLVLDTNVVDGVCHPKLMYCSKIGENFVAGDIVEYEFYMGEVARNYNPKTGEHGELVTVTSELELFMSDLNSNIEATSVAYVHMDRTVNHRKDRNVTDKLNRIGEACGLDMRNHQYSGNGGGGKGSIFGSQAAGNAYQNEESVPNQQINSLEELDSVLGDDNSELPFE